MPGGRSQRPLFDLLREQGRAESKPHAPNAPTSAPTGTTTSPTGSASSPAGGDTRTASVLEPKPVGTTGTPGSVVPSIAKPRVVSAMPRPRESEPEAAAPTGKHGIVIPVNAMYVAPVVVLVIVLAVWMLGVRWGRNDAERDLANSGIALPSTAPVDPLANSDTASRTGTSGKTVAPPPPIERAQPESTITGPNGVAIDPNGKILSARGPLASDPRQKGTNYLHIASLPKEDAQNALAYLAQNKIDAIAIPMEVDSGAQAAKNKPWFQVVVLVGITSDEYRNRDKPGRAKQAEATIRKLGAAWKNDKRGPSDFGKILWVRY